MAWEAGDYKRLNSPWAPLSLGLAGLGIITLIHYTFTPQPYLEVITAANFLPIAYVAVRLGVRAALGVGILATLVTLPHEIFFHEEPVSWDELGMGLLLVSGGVLAGWLSDRERWQQHRYQNLFESASDAIIVYDSQRKIVAANESAASLTGHPRNQLLGEDIGRFLLPLAEGGEMRHRQECRLVSRDGEEVVVELTQSAVIGEGPSPSTQLILRDVTAQRKLQQTIRDYAGSVTRVQEEERRRIARELHDEASQNLVVLSRHLDALSQQKGIPARIRAGLEEAEGLVTSTLAGIRNFTQGLRPSVLDDLGLLPAVEWLCDRLASSGSLATEVKVDGTPRRLPSEIEVVLFRVVQEALNNVEKHSEATSVTIKVEFAPHQVMVQVRDNGQGFSLPADLGEIAAQGKFGLLGMEERLQLVGGKLELASAPERGTTITARVPA